MRHGGRGVVDGIRRIDVPCVVDAPCRGVRRACRLHSPVPRAKALLECLPADGIPEKTRLGPLAQDTRAVAANVGHFVGAAGFPAAECRGADAVGRGSDHAWRHGGGGRSLLEPPPRGAAPGSLPTGGLGPDSVLIFRRNDKSTVSEGAAPADIVPEGLVHCLVGLSTPLTFRTSWHTRARRPVAGVPGFAQVTLMVTVSFSVILIGVTQ